MERIRKHEKHKEDEVQKGNKKKSTWYSNNCVSSQNIETLDMESKSRVQRQVQTPGN